MWEGTTLKITYVVIALLAGVVPSAAAQDPSPGGLALIGANVIDVHTGAIQPETTVLTRGNQIATVGPSATTAIPDDVRVVDARGKYLIPGLIDTHVHLEEQWAMQPADTLAQLGWILAAGVTTVREASAWYSAEDRQACATCIAENLIALREASEDGRILAPRLYLSAIPHPALRERLGAATTTEAVQRYRDLGMDAVKITNQAPELALRTIREAAATGVPVWGHTSFFTEDGRIDNYTLRAVHAGISGVTHTQYIYLVRPERDRRPPRRGPDGEWRSWRKWRLHLVTGWHRTEPLDIRAVIAAMVSRGVWLEPTLLAARAEFEAGRYDAAALSRYHTWVYGESLFRWWERRMYSRAWNAMGRFVRNFYEAGGTVVAGSDVMPFPPLGVTEEMRLLVEVGLPPLAALQAATVNAARALRLDHRIGTVEEGKFADLVLLEDNPLADITNIRTVAVVVTNGRLIERQALDRILMRTGTPRSQ